MGNGVGKLTVCFTGVGPAGEDARRRRRDAAVGMVVSETLDDLGHAFSYIRPEMKSLDAAEATTTTTTFKSISGAAVSANTSTPLSTSLLDLCCDRFDRASAFESSTSFASLPLQPIPRNSSLHSGPLFHSGLIPNSGPLERGFMSGPIERASISGVLDKGCADTFPRSFSVSHGGFVFRSRSRKVSLLRILKRALSRGIARGQNSIVAPIKGIVAVKETDNWVAADTEKKNQNLTISTDFTLDDDDDPRETQNLQWAQGKAGEDRVHVVVQEDEGWVFVGIYDGFNGPDAPDYLLSNLYPSLRKELEGILWEDDNNTSSNRPETSLDDSKPDSTFNRPHNEAAEKSEESCSKAGEQESHHHYHHPYANDDGDTKRESKTKSKYRGAAKKWEESQRRWRCEWDRERLELDRRLNDHRGPNPVRRTANHEDVLKALSEALKKTEESYLDNADKMVMRNPELALMGSCVLVMLMKEDDVYIMNVGDSRAILAQKKEPDLWSQELEKIKEETLYDLEAFDEDDQLNDIPSLTALQLTMEHSTSIEQEVSRIRKEHPEDASAVINDRVKGSLKVTRAFGAGFLKQPKWNKALLEMFRIDYIGSSPYISCEPWLHHHKLSQRDQFLILSSDGLYQYFTNEEAVSEVQLFLSWSPEGDPAQHLVEELLFRAAKRAGMDFHELLEIPQGDRRRYHDDVSIIVISLEGRIWSSSAY